MALDKSEVVGECVGSHHDDFLLGSGYVGVVRKALNFSGVRRTNVVVFIVGLTVIEKDVTGGDRVEFIPNPKVKTKRTLHLRLQAGNGQAECSRQVIDDVFQGIEVINWGEELWASRELGLRLPVSNLDIGDAVLLEELEYVV